MPGANRHVFEWNTVPSKDRENKKEAANQAASDAKNLGQPCLGQPCQFLASRVDRKDSGSSGRRPTVIDRSAGPAFADAR
jgi:hypothetical protein